MGMLDTNYFPFYERMKVAPKETGERLEIALSYIDFIVSTLLRYHKNMSARSIRGLISDGEKNWNKMVGQGLAVQIDPDDGADMFLNPINYPEMFLSRIIGSSSNNDEYTIMADIAKNVSSAMGWGDLQIVEEVE